MAPVLALNAKPRARRDIISAILSHYGDERDVDDQDDVLAAYYHQASPTPAPPDRSSKPLPSVPSLTQLRDRGRGAHRVNRGPATDKDDKDSTQEPQARIMAPRSLSRSQRPPQLRLVKSNGSTATSAKTPSQSSSPPADSPSTQHPERGRRHARGRLDDELPLPPPPPELPSKPDNVDDIMGSSKSKLQQNDAEPPRRHHHFSLRRKPVKKSTPAAADPPAPQPAAPLAAQHETKVHPPKGPPAPPPKLKKVKSDEALMSSSSSSKHARGPSNAVSEPITVKERNHLPEPSEDTVRIHRQRSNTPPSEPDQNEPITPPLKPGDPVQLLPSPTPVPAESPSKWGLAKRSSNLNMNDDVDLKSNMHFRGKSSTGFDIFKTTSNELKSTMPLSPVLSPTSDSIPAMSKENQKPLISPIKPPTPPKDTPPTSPPALPTHHLFNTCLRPKRTTAALLNRVHTACYHNHGRFHRSTQRFVPIDCMMCFSSPPDHQWTCTWCALRICQTCRSKLDAVPRRNLEALIQGRLSDWEKKRKQRDSMQPQRNIKAETVRVKGRERSSVIPIGKLGRQSRSEPLTAGSWE